MSPAIARFEYGAWSAVVGGFEGPPVAAEVRADDGVPGGHQQRRDPVPGRVGARVAVQQDHRRARSRRSSTRSSTPPPTSTSVSAKPSNTPDIVHAGGMRSSVGGWDVIVVRRADPPGARPPPPRCGSGRPRRVLLLDRSEFPRDKPCGDGIAAGVLERLAGLGVDPAGADGPAPSRSAA